MAKNDASPTVKSKRRGPKLLTIVLAMVLVFSIAVDSFCIYDILGAKIVSSATFKSIEEEEFTEEMIELQEEREAEQKEKEDKGSEDDIPFDFGILGDNDDNQGISQDDSDQIMKRIAPSIGIKDPENELEHYDTTETELYVYHSYLQMHNGVPVEGTRIVAQVDKDTGDVVDVTGDYLEIPDDFSMEMTISFEDAKKLVRDYMATSYKMKEGEYTLDNKGKRLFSMYGLAVVYGYCVQVQTPTGLFLSFAINGQNGTIASVSDNTSLEMIDAKLRGQEVDQSLRVYRENDEQYILRDDERNIAVYVADRSQNPTVAKGLTPHAWDPVKGSADQSGVDALANIQRVYDFYDKVLGFKGPRNDENYQLPVYVGVNVLNGSDLTDNAAMYGNSAMAVGVKSDGSSEYSAEFDVMAHEYTHSMVYTRSTLTQLSYVPEKDKSFTPQKGINEALADIFAEMAEDYSADGALNGDCDYKSSVRDMASPAMDDYSNFVYGTTECHTSASLVTYPYYYMAKAGKNPIPQQTLVHLYYEVIPKLTSHTDFRTYRKALEANALIMKEKNDGWGTKYSDQFITAEQMETVIDAFDAVGIPADNGKRVVSGGKVVVYDKNNKPFSNYKLTITGRFNADKVFYETDVTSDSFTLPADLVNGYYTLKVTDLDNSYAFETINIAVNDNAPDQKVSAYPDTLKVFTTFGSDARDVVLVLDTSGSMDGDPIEQTRNAASKFVNSVLDGGSSSRISVVDFDSSATTLVSMSDNRTELLNAVQGLDAYGETNTHEGLSLAGDILETSSAGKKLIVLMSDGAPQSGENYNGDYNTPIVELAQKLKDKGIIIYTLGFYHNLYGDEKLTCQKLMTDIATPGYDYVVGNSDDLDFTVGDPGSELYEIFDDFADMVNGKKYINIRIACPVDVTVSYGGETLSSAKKSLNTRTSFGSLSIEKEIDEDTGEETGDTIKTLRLDDSANYELTLNGTAKGTMEYTISYPDENGEYSDVREFQSVPLTKDTVISTSTAVVEEKTTMLVDNDGDGSFDLSYDAGANKKAKKTKTEENWTKKSIVLFTSSVIIVCLCYFLVIVIKKIKAAKRAAAATKCSSCGAAIVDGIKFCRNCGTPVPVPSENQQPITPQKKGHAGLVVKLSFIALFSAVTLVVIGAYNSSATSVYRELCSNRTESAKMIYTNAVKGSALSDKYLSIISSSRIDKAQKAYDEGKYSKEEYRAFLDCIVKLDIGKASEKADDLLDELGNDEDTADEETTETTSEEETEASETEEESN